MNKNIYRWVTFLPNKSVSFLTIIPFNMSFIHLFLRFNDNNLSVLFCII